MEHIGQFGKLAKAGFKIPRHVIIHNISPTGRKILIFISFLSILPNWAWNSNEKNLCKSIMASFPSILNEYFEVKLICRHHCGKSSVRL